MAQGRELVIRGLSGGLLSKNSQHGSPSYSSSGDGESSHEDDHDTNYHAGDDEEDSEEDDYGEYVEDSEDSLG